MKVTLDDASVVIIEQRTISYLVTMKVTLDDDSIVSIENNSLVSFHISWTLPHIVHFLVVYCIQESCLSI